MGKPQDIAALGRAEDAPLIAMHAGRREQARELANAIGANMDQAETVMFETRGISQGIGECIDLLNKAGAAADSIKALEALAEEAKARVLVRSGIFEALKHTHDVLQGAHDAETDRLSEVVNASAKAKNLPPKPKAKAKPRARRTGKHPGPSISGSRRQAVLKNKDGADT